MLVRSHTSCIIYAFVFIDKKLGPSTVSDVRGEGPSRHEEESPDTRTALVKGTKRRLDGLKKSRKKSNTPPRAYAWALL